MTFSILTADTAAAAWDRARRRVLISGDPNAGKTTSLRTVPRPLAWMSYPGERGMTSLDLSREADIKAWVGDPYDPSKPTNWMALIEDIRKATNEIIAGKHGKFRSFAGDGLHQMYKLCLAAVTAGANMRGEDFEPAAYGKAHKLFFDDYLRRILDSPIEYAFFTVWSGREKDDPTAKGKDATSHVFPELPGAAAKQILGHFAVSLYATKMGSRYVFQTKPQGAVWGCGLKLPVEIADKIPAFVDQDWSKLEPLLTMPKVAA